MADFDMTDFNGIANFRNVYFDYTASVKSTSKCQIKRCIDSIFGYIIGLT